MCGLRPLSCPGLSVTALGGGWVEPVMWHHRRSRLRPPHPFRYLFDAGVGVGREGKEEL